MNEMKLHFVFVEQANLSSFWWIEGTAIVTRGGGRKSIDDDLTDLCAEASDVASIC